MSVQEKISNAYQLYLLTGKNINETLKLTKITRGTLKKYITIQECLDFEILEYLDKKGKDKLAIGEALKLCDKVLNPEQQYEVFQHFIQSNKNDRWTILRDNTECVICMDSNALFEYTPCCKTPICERCFTKTFQTYIQDIIFKPVDCPFCKQSFDLAFVYWFLNNRFGSVSRELWRNSDTYHSNISHRGSYLTNLHNKYITMITKIEQKQEYYLTDEKPDFKTLLGNEKYFGPCSACTPKFLKFDRVIKDNRWAATQICDIPKECGNGEGGLLVLQPEMFRCVVCKSRDEDYDNGEFKKCPHCGIKTIKPDGCNFIYCEDHRWCFICNERIENNENGHNKHYWTGPGTSPYSNRCRQSFVEATGSKFIINGICDCSACKDHNGRPLCRTLDCMNRTEESFGIDADGEVIFHRYCQECRRS